MAEVILIKDIFDAEAVENIAVKEGVDLETILKERNLLNDGEETEIETYNTKTGQTKIKSVIKNTNIKVYVNQEEKDIDYKCKEDDHIVIMLLPMSSDPTKGWSWAETITTLIYAPLAWVPAVINGNYWGAAFSLLGLGSIGTLPTGLYDLMEVYKPETKKTTNLDNDPNGANAPTIAGAENGSIIGNTIPLLLGNYRVTPFLGASPYTTFDTTENKFGRSQYINLLYVLGYAPIFPTKFRFDSLTFAENDKNVIDGILSYKKGDIGSRWQSNNIELEIRQLGKYPTLYPYAVKEFSPSAVLMYCYDKSYQEEEQENGISWGGGYFPCGFKTNSTYLTEDFPRRIEVDIDFPNGLYAARSETHNSVSATYYHKLDMNLAIQWRVRTKKIDENPDLSVNGFHSGLGDAGWHNFDGITTGDDIKNKWTADLSLRELRNNEGVTYDSSTETLTPVSIIPELSSSGEGYTKVSLNIFFNEDKTKKTVQNYTIEHRDWYRHHRDDDEDRYYITYAIEYSTSGDVLSITLKGREGSTEGTRTVTLNLSDFSTAFLKSYDTNPYWDDCDIFNFGYYSRGEYSSYFGTEGIKYTAEDSIAWALPDGTWYPKNQMRFTAYANIPDSVIKQLRQLNDDDSDSVIKKLEVRIVRLTPCYVDGVVSNSGIKQGPANYSDVVKWSTLRTYSYDEDILRNGGYDEDGNSIPVWDGATALTQNYYQRPYSYNNKNKLCVVALRAKADSLEVMSSSVEKMNVMLQAITPKWSETEHKWYPSDIKRTKMYHCVVHDSNGNLSTSQNFYEKEYDSSSKWTETKDTYKAWKETFGYTVEVFKENDGNNWFSQMKKLMSERYDSNTGCYYIDSDFITRYTANNAMSTLLLAFVGQHLGRNAYGYDSINMGQLAESWCQEAHMSDGNLTDQPFGANAYIYQSRKLSDIFSNILLAGRAYACIDELDRWEVHVDMPQDNPVDILNQENVLSSSNTRNYAESLAGYKITFSDENDDYERNTFRTMKDGESQFRPSRDIQDLTLYDFVTNAEQYNSLARYNLASNITQREAWTRVVGAIGYKFKIGSLVHDSHTAILVGTDYGARIEELIEDDNYIYGFNTDKPYVFTAEFNDDSTNKLGVEICQSGTGSQRGYCTMRLIGKDGLYIPVKDGMPDSSATTKVLYQMLEEYETNSVLFASPIDKATARPTDLNYAEDAVMTYNPCVGDIVSFGYIGEITVPALVMGIKPDKNHKFTLTLIPYDEGIYKAGAKLPVYKTHMTERDPSAAIVGSNYSVQNITPIGASADDIDKVNSSISDLAEIVSSVKTIKDITVYKRYPAKPDSSGINSSAIFDFSTGDFSWVSPDESNGWSYNFPASGSENVYMCTCTVSGNTSIEIPLTKWSDPVLYVKNGSDGINSAKFYKIVASDDIIFRYKNGTLSTNTEKFSFYKTIEADTNSVSVYYKIYSKGSYNTKDWTLVKTGYGADVSIDVESLSVLKCEIYEDESYEMPLDMESIAIISDGDDAVVIDLENETTTIPATVDGTPKDLSGTTSSIYIFQGITALSMGSADKAGQFAIEITYDNVTVDGEEILKPSQYCNEDNNVYVNEDGELYGLDFYTLPAVSSFTGSTGSRSITVRGQTFTGKSFEVTKAQTFAKSYDGATGISRNVIYIYRRSKIALKESDLPTGNATYNFSENSLEWSSTSASNGWTLTVPSSYDGSCLYKSHAVAVSNEATDTIKASEWWFDGIDVSDEATYKAKYDEYLQNLTPTCYLDTTSATFAVDNDCKTPLAQKFSSLVHVVQGGDELDFSIDKVESPYGITYVRDDRTIVFCIGQGIRLSSFDIKITISANSKSYDEAYTNENNLIYTDGTNSYGKRIYTGTKETFEKTISVAVVKGGIYRGPFSSVSEISSMGTRIVGDYITWTGVDTVTALSETGKLLMGGVYEWNGTVWIKCEKDSCNAAALSDVLSVVNADLKNNNSTAWDYLYHLTANSIFADMILANTIKVNKLFAQNITMGKGGVIKSGNFNGTVASDGSITADGSAGWAIDYNGKAVFNNVTVGGYATSKELSSKANTSDVNAALSEKANASVVTTIKDNLDKTGITDYYKTYGKTIISGGYLNTGIIQAGSIAANMIAVNDLFAQTITMSNAGVIQTAGFVQGASSGFKLDGTTGTIYANGGSFTGTVNATSGSFTGTITVGSASSIKSENFTQTEAGGDWTGWAIGGMYKEQLIDNIRVKGISSYRKGRVSITNSLLNNSTVISGTLKSYRFYNDIWTDNCTYDYINSLSGKDLGYFNDEDFTTPVRGKVVYETQYEVRKNYKIIQLFCISYNASYDYFTIYGYQADSTENDVQTIVLTRTSVTHSLIVSDDYSLKKFFLVKIF